MSVATIRPAAEIYREDQYYAWWKYAIVAAPAILAVVLLSHQIATGVLGLRTNYPAIVARSLVCLAAIFFSMVSGIVLMKMTTVLTLGRLMVWYGWRECPANSLELAADAIVNVDCITIDGQAGFPFPGRHKQNPGEMVFIVRGGHAVRIDLADGTRIILGTARAEELAGAIRRMIVPR